jgi:predicted acylesterase/phospholipase RssA
MATKKGLVISGGGAYGAYGVGTIAGLDKDYDVVAGVSTGALMGALVMLKKWDTLKDAYTSVNQKSIFDSKWYRPNVFKKNGKLNLLSVLYVIITRMFKKNITLATTNAMRKLIDKFLTKKILRRSEL